MGYRHSEVLIYAIAAAIIIIIIIIIIVTVRSSDLNLDVIKKYSRN